MLTDLVKTDPLVHLSDVTQYLQYVFERPVHDWTTSRLLKKLGWSWKVPVRFQLRKYTTRNLERYLHYMTAIQQVNPARLRFLDEAHFVSKQLTNRKVLGLVKDRVWVKQSTLNQKKWFGMQKFADF